MFHMVCAQVSASKVSREVGVICIAHGKTIALKAPPFPGVFFVCTTSSAVHHPKSILALMVSFL